MSQSDIPAQLITLNNLADAVLYFTDGKQQNPDIAVLIDAILERTNKPLDRGIWNIEDQPHLPEQNPRLHRWAVYLMLMPEFKHTNVGPGIIRWLDQDPALDMGIFKNVAHIQGAFYTYQIAYAILHPRHTHSVGTHIVGSYWNTRDLHPAVLTGEHADDYVVRLYQLLYMISPWLPELTRYQTMPKRSHTQQTECCSRNGIGVCSGYHQT